MAPPPSSSHHAKTLLSLYQQLRQAIDEEDEEVIHSTLEKLLSDKNQSSSSSNNELKQCKTINLIQRGEFQKALDSIGNNNLSLKTSLQKIYCLYRLNRSEEALKEISNLEQSNNKNHLSDHTLLLHLKAQIYYRMGCYNESSQIYESILQKEYPNASSNHTIDNDELLTNMSASFTMNGNYQRGISITKQSDHNTHELAYNAACASIGLKDYEQAAKYLEFSKKLCKDDPNELTSIMVQLAFVRYLNGQVEESKNMFEHVFNHSSKDSVACAVAANNLVAIQSNPSLNPSLTSNDVLDAQKKLKYAYQDKLQGKLTTQQIKGVTLNNALLLLQMNKYEECERVVQTELKKLYQEEFIPTLILSYIYLKQKKFKESIQVLEEYLKQSTTFVDKSSLDGGIAQLALAQYYLQQGTPEFYKECIQVLNQSKFRNQKGVESLLIALYMKLEDMDSALDLFQKSFLKYSSGGDGGGDDESSSSSGTTTSSSNNTISTTQTTWMVEMATELARLQMAHKKYKEAASTYEMLTKMEPNHIQHLAGLIDAMSYYDIDAAEKFAKNLPHITTTSGESSLNIEALEKTSAVSMFTSSSANNKTSDHSVMIPSISSSNQQHGTSSDATTNTTSKRQSNALQRADEKKKQQRKKRRNKLPIGIAHHDTLSKEFKSRWESKKKQVVKTGTGFGHQGSSDVEAQKAISHKKGQKTLLTPEQALGLKSSGGAGGAGGAGGTSAGKKKSKKK
ncbi:hypothetical protein FDP41_004499 [Naegleria fowleri]|uniref:Signal recognition particle subunit SRP72 n=1 Tax=Naegleria fowleri TaxID=5763 RepID=A0A6A5BS11_NAEFO|nr:uncharacterized protein FDP41_004499 [Naegleria fowleri]KAF0976600.1 hypothetical protein FDP41_004499 [Naegleria fowleri]